MLTPVAPYIAIRRDPPKEEVGGIKLSSGAIEKPNTGTVLSSYLVEDYVTEDRATHTSRKIMREGGLFRKGQRILFPEYAGTEILLEGDTEPLLILEETEVMAILPESH